MDFENDFQHRWVTFNKKAKVNIKALEGKIERFNNVLTSIHIFLQGSAHRGKLINKQKKIYLYQTQKQSQTPSFKVYYTYDKKYVTVRYIRIATENAD